MQMEIGVYRIGSAILTAIEWSRGSAEGGWKRRVEIFFVPEITNMPPTRRVHSFSVNGSGMKFPDRSARNFSLSRVYRVQLENLGASSAGCIRLGRKVFFDRTSRGFGVQVKSITCC